MRPFCPYVTTFTEFSTLLRVEKRINLLILQLIPAKTACSREPLSFRWRDCLPSWVLASSFIKLSAPALTPHSLPSLVFITWSPGSLSSRTFAPLIGKLVEESVTIPFKEIVIPGLGKIGCN